MDEYMTYGFEGQGTIGTPPTIRRDAEVIKDAKYRKLLKFLGKASMTL